MPGLHELQCRFRDALLGGDLDGVTCDIRPGGLTAARRLGIYRNNVFTNQREALRTIYSVTERLVGVEFFNYLADEYLRCHGAPAGDLNRLGEHLAEFLCKLPTASPLVYLPDTARLEWLAHRVYHGPDHGSLPLERLAGVPPEQYEALRFKLHPASGLFESRYPVHRIWEVNQPGYEGDDLVDLDSGGVRLLAERRGGRVELRVLEAGEWSFLKALASDRTFGEACDAALVAAEEFDLEATLPRLIEESTLVDLVAPAPESDRY